MKIPSALLVGLALLSAGCTTQPEKVRDDKLSDHYKYVPVDPIFVQSGPRLGIESLFNESMFTALDETVIEGSATFPLALARGRRYRYKFTTDYLKFTAIPSGEKKGGSTEDDKNQRQASNIFYVGIGVRLVAEFETQSRSLGLASLSEIGAAAQAGKASGRLLFQTIGISGPEITALIPISTELSKPAIDHAMQALAQIKSKIYTASTASQIVFTPTVSSFRAPAEEIERIRENLPQEIAALPTPDR